MPDDKKSLGAMVTEIFDLYRLIAAARSRRPSGSDDLSETEFITLDLLAKAESLTIGEVQKRIGVVPAQMSRIVRSLEEQGGRGYVECKINPSDRRRVDVSLTEIGRAAHRKFVDARLGSMHDILTVLSPDDRENFMRIMRSLKDAFEQKLDSG